MLSLTNNQKNILGSLLIALLCYAYPLQVFIISVLKLGNSTPINIAFRSAYVFLSIFLIFSESLKKEVKVYKYAHISLLFFWIIYGIRLVYDIEIRNIVFLENAFYVYSMAFGNVLIPTIAIILIHKYIKIKTLVQFIAAMIAMSNIAVLYMLAQGETGISLLLFLERATIYHNDIAVINPISISMVGLNLSSLMLAFLLFFKSSLKAKLLGVFPLFMLGTFNLIAGGSRGPMLYFFIVLLIALFLYLNDRKYIFTRFLRLLFYFSIFIILLLPKIVSFVNNNNIAIVSRLITFSENREAGIKEERDASFEGALQQFLRSPIIGDAYLGEIDNFYPHNILLEMLMATGILGAIFFMTYFLSMLKTLFFVGNSDKYNIILKIWVITGILLSLSSGCIFASMEFFVLGAYTLTVK